MARHLHTLIRRVMGRFPFLAALALLSARPAFADDGLAAELRALGSASREDVQKAIAALGERGDAAALPALDALYDERLMVGPDGAVYVKDSRSRTLHDAVTGAVIATEPAALRPAESSNEIRRAIKAVSARLQLGASDPALRIAAADELAKDGSERAVAAVRAAQAREADPKVKQALSLALARADLKSTDATTRMSALKTLESLGGNAVKSDLEALLAKRPDGSFQEPDEQVRKAAQSALGAIRSREAVISRAGDLIYGVSLASVFLFAALGLAITFGVMGVINMAHGEMLTIGAYTTYVVQVLFQKAGLAPYYLLAAVPAAFVMATATGILLERTVIRWLYGRPLETLLATWGISLGLIQTIRLIFGAANVAVENPRWLAGGWQVASGLVISYSRMGVVAFVVVAALFVWFLLTKTSLGLQMRAVTQNRAMAACMGVRTSRVDMWTFGLGSGIAGLGGVALSQLGNVGPELGQTYILDSFMVVVLGGVGRIAGTVAAALGLGIIQKLAEPLSGPVLGKIVVLVLIILFIQRRPQGMFPQKGRVEA